MKRNALCSLLLIIMMVMAMPAMAGFSFASENVESVPMVLVKATAVRPDTVALKWNSIFHFRS